METPFVFGKLAVERNFTNREKERQRLTGNFSGLVNTVLISPRRWGKSSLVQKSAIEAMSVDENLHFCFLDAFNIRTEEQFYLALASEVLKISASKMEVLTENAKRFMGAFLPKLSFNPENQDELSLSLDWKEVKKHPDAILDMAEKIAAEKGWKLVICIDEFQNIATFENQLAFQKKLRSHWQKHQHVAYCLYGSKRHMLMDVFTSPSMPFYKFGDILFLEKIAMDSWVPFLCSRFDDTQKYLSESDAALIATLAECHPYYVQQLAQQSWFRTATACSEEIIREAHEGVVSQLSLLFQSKTEELSTPQVNFLKALLDGIEKFSSKNIIDDYRLGSSANVARIKKALENKEIIDILAGNILVLDPMYKNWLATRYFIKK
ncbi:MAG: ATPase [Bacteroidota bacterium]|nr:ATPase [Odoribacter sp.]MDP3645442.1 ATPase [Bacteroidota bacterium]